MAAERNTEAKLVDIFNKIWTQYHEIDSSIEPTNSPSLQTSISETLKQVDFLIETIKQLDMFSANEVIDEIATSDLRYLLLHALSASLAAKKQSDRNERPLILQDSIDHFRSFLKLCSCYDTGRSAEIDKILENSENSEQHSFSKKKTTLQSMAAVREAKIARYRKAKLQAQQIQDMENRLHDEEIARKYWLMQIDKWIDTSSDEIASMSAELDMLNKFKNISKENFQKPDVSIKPPMKPFILTKDRLQASVFGAGYPSLPTMTLDEYFEKEAAAGRMPDQFTNPHNANDTKNEDDSDKSDDEVLKKQRHFDDWKDTHRRGSGNRKNMG